MVRVRAWSGLLALALLPAIFKLLLSPVFILLGLLCAVVAVVLLVLTSNILFGLILDRYYASRPPPRAAAPGRTLRFSTPAAWQAAVTKSQWSYKSPNTLPPLVPDFPVVSQSLNDMMIFIVRDFILTWYKDISSSPAFPTAISATIHSSLESLLTRLSHLDLPEFVVRKVLPHITLHVQRFRDSEMAVRGSTLERHLTRSDELDILLASRYGAGGHLHSAIANLSTMTTRQDEEAYFRRVLDKVLKLILPSNEASKSVVIVAREILSCLVLSPVMESLSDPDFWNRAIDQAAGEAIQQQKMISQVRQVLEKGTRRDKIPQPHPENITFATDTKRFESFLRSIDRTNSLLDARRMKNDISGEIRRTRLMLADHEDREWINGVKTETIVAFLDRLYTAKRHADNRIILLGGHSEEPQSSSAAINETNGNPRLRDILQNPSSLSYFMEFMDRRDRSQLVQFWLTVESFKDPLESLDSSGDDDIGTLQAEPDQSRMRGDVSMLLDLYFPSRGPSQLLSIISSGDVQTMRSFATNMPQTVSNTRLVRRAVLMSQSQVEKGMDQDFVDFRNSDLWYRAIKDLPQATQSIPQSGHISSFDVKSAPKSLSGGTGDALVANIRSSPASSIQQDLKGSIGTLSNLDLLMERSEPSLAAKAARSPLFEDAFQPGASLFADTEDSEKMDQIQAALTDIIVHERFSDTRSVDSRPTLSDLRAFSEGEISTNAAGFDEEPQPADPSTEEAGGDITRRIMLSGRTLRNAILQIDKSVQDLKSQEAMLSALIRKAELTGDQHKLHLLAKSKKALDREIRELHFQKDQYEQQEVQSRISAGRTTVTIPSATLQEDDGGKSYVRYLVEVQQSGVEGAPGMGWVIARRYNEFLALHQRLREEYSLVRALDFPGKRLVTNMSPLFIESRRLALEKYLQNLVNNPIISINEEVGNFLSKDFPFQVATPQRPGSRPNLFAGQSIVRNVYKSVTESIDDMFYGPSMLDVVIQSLTTQAAQVAGIVGAGVNDEDLVARAFKAKADARSIPPEAQLLELSTRIPTLEGESIASSFSAPICDLILAVFELDPKNNWLRRQAIVMILQQVLGSTIERKVHDLFKTHSEESQVLSLINIIKEDIWPKGQLNTSRVARTAEERTKTRHSANQKLSTFMPDLAASVLGRSNARRGARRIFSVLQNRRLNQHILYTILDEAIQALFPEIMLEANAMGGDT